MVVPPEAGQKRLFACSKCYTRHAFEELSSGQQICKKCREGLRLPVLSCSYCRTEFRQEDTKKSRLHPICKKCESDLQKYGKPTRCEHCRLNAAFLKQKCRR